MIGMNFRSFLVLLIAAVVAAAVIHYVARYRFLEGFDGFVGKCLAAWAGGWVGSPVLGHWFESAKIAGIYLIPALIGAFGAAFIVPATAKGLAKVFAAARLRRRSNPCRRLTQTLSGLGAAARLIGNCRLPKLAPAGDFPVFWAPRGPEAGT